jgi:two-component system LytT family response regulator
MKVLIAEKDTDTRQVLADLLKREGHIVDAGIADSVTDAVVLCRSTHPDLLIAGTDLPGGGGFSLLRSLGATAPKYVIFVAPGGEDALAAFSFHPLDYLVRPIDGARFLQAIAQIRRGLEEPGWEDVRILALDKGQVREHVIEGPRRLMIRNGGRICFLRHEDIDWVEAERDYVCIHNGGRRHLIREKISNLERSLSPAQFVRIHRSVIVNADRIREMQPLSSGEYAVILQDGTRLTLSRSFRELAFERLTSAA